VIDYILELAKISERKVGPSELIEETAPQAKAESKPAKKAATKASRRKKAAEEEPAAQGGPAAGETTE